MKKLALLLLFAACIFKYGFAQTAQKEINIAQFTNQRALAADSQFIYCGIYASNFFEFIPTRTYLYKLDYSLNVLDSFYFDNYLGLDTSSYFLIGDIKLDNNGFIYFLGVLATNDTSSCTNYKSLIFKFNQNLVPVDSLVLSNDSIEMLASELYIKEKLMIVAGGGYQCKKTDRKPLVAKINLKNKNIKYRFFRNLGYSGSTSDFTDPIVHNNKIILNTDHNITVTSGAILATAILDTNLELMNSGNVLDTSGLKNTSISGGGAFVPVGHDSVWKIGPTNTYLPPDFWLKYYNFGVSLLDSQYNVSEIDTFALSGLNWQTKDSGHLRLAPSLDAYDFLNSDSVLFIQREKSVYFSSYHFKDSVAFRIYNFNARLGQMNWMKRVQRYTAVGGHSVAALPGNRWAISFNEYDWRKVPSDNMIVHIWILNGQGDILSQREFKTRKNEIVLFPNPAQNVLQLQGLPQNENPFDYKIANALGQIIKSGSLIDAKLNIESLPSGSYFLILTNGGMQLAKPFVKE